MFASAATSAKDIWIEKFRQVMHYYVPPLEPTAEVNVGALVAIAFGLFLVFRGGKHERHVVTGFALVLGGYIGHLLSRYIGFVSAPGPITIAICAVALAAIAYKTYTLWLAGGSVVVLFCIGLTFQLGSRDLNKFLPQSNQYSPGIEDGMIAGLPEKSQQIRNQNADWQTQLSRIGENVVSEIREFEWVSWVIPVAAAIFGAALAFWALRTFAIFWLGFIGANIAVIGGCTVLCANWNNLRDPLFGQPHIPAFIALGLWTLGLIWQARSARFPKKSAAPAEGGENKS